MILILRYRIFLYAIRLVIRWKSFIFVLLKVCRVFCRNIRNKSQLWCSQSLYRKHRVKYEETYRWGLKKFNIFLWRPNLFDKNKKYSTSYKIHLVLFSFRKLRRFWIIWNGNYQYRYDRDINYTVNYRRTDIHRHLKVSLTYI